MPQGTKITDEQVYMVRQLFMDGKDRKSIAKVVGVSYASVCDILSRGRNYKRRRI